MTDTPQAPKGKPIRKDKLPALAEKIAELATLDPPEVPRAHAIGQHAETLLGMLDRGWTEEAICEALKEFLPGLTPAALRFYLQPPKKRRRVQKPAPTTTAAPPLAQVEPAPAPQAAASDPLGLAGVGQRRPGRV